MYLLGLKLVTMGAFRPISNLLEFHFQRQPKPQLFISYHTKCFSANYTPAAVSSFFNQGISLHPNNSVEHQTSHTEMHFLGQVMAYSNFFAENRVVEPFQRNTEDAVCSFVLLLLLCCSLVTKQFMQLYAFLEIS